MNSKSTVQLFGLLAIAVCPFAIQACDLLHKEAADAGPAASASAVQAAEAPAAPAVSAVPGAVAVQPQAAHHGAVAPKGSAAVLADGGAAPAALGGFVLPAGMPSAIVIPSSIAIPSSISIPSALKVPSGFPPFPAASAPPAKK